MQVPVVPAFKKRPGPMSLDLGGLDDGKDSPGNDNAVEVSDAPVPRVPPLKGSIKRPGAMMMSLNLDGLHEEKGSHALTVEDPNRRSPRIGGLSLELGSSPRGPHVMEDSWKVRALVTIRRLFRPPHRAHSTQNALLCIMHPADTTHNPTRRHDYAQGEILPGFLFLGDRLTAGESDRLNSLGITHVLNVTQDIPNFYENKDVGSSERRLTYKRCALKDRIDADIGEHFSGACDFINRARYARCSQSSASLACVLAGLARLTAARGARSSCTPAATARCTAPAAKARCTSRGSAPCHSWTHRCSLRAALTAAWIAGLCAQHSARHPPDRKARALAAAPCAQGKWRARSSALPRGHVALGNGGDRIPHGVEEVDAQEITPPRGQLPLCPAQLGLHAVPDHARA